MTKNIKQKILDTINNNQSIVIVGETNAGKSYFIKNELIPYLSEKFSIEYFAESDFVKDTNKEIVIIDEVETLFDKEFLEKLHPEETPYYTDNYIDKVKSRHKKYKIIKNPTIYIITRNLDEEIKNLINNFKYTDWDNRTIDVIKFTK